MTTKILCVAAMALFPACSAVSTSARLSPGTDLAKYQTFGWAPRPNAAPQSLAEQSARSSIEQALAQKGIRPAAGGAPDFLVDYHAKTQQKVDVYPGMYGAWDYPDVNTYTEGTLIVDFIDPNTHKIFWRGTASGVVDQPDNPDEQKIAEAVDKLMQKYPSQVASTPREHM